MKMDLLFRLCVLIFLWSCSAEGMSDDELMSGFGLEYDLDELTSEYERVSDNDSGKSEWIRLELHPHSLIDDISKLAVYEKYFVILTLGQNKDVLLFRKDDGAFVYSFKSDHPELLSDVTDFEIFRDEIYVSNNEKRILSVFDLSDLPFIYFNRVIQSDLKFDKFCIVDSANILVYPYMATLNMVENQMLNYDLLLLDENLHMKNSYLPYPVEKFHYGPSYNSTTKINFVAPFYESEENEIYFADLMRDTTYKWDSEKNEIIPFAYHKENTTAQKITKEIDLKESIAMMQNSGHPFGAQIFYADEEGFIFSSVVDSKIYYIYISFSASKYKLLNIVDFKNEMTLMEAPLGFPFLHIDSKLNVYAVIIPYLYPEEELQEQGLVKEDNPVIVKYSLDGYLP